MNDVDVIHRALGRLVRGERTPAQLMGVAPRVVNGLYAIGLAAQSAGRHAAAENVFQRCVMLDPYRAEFWIGLAAARQAQGRVDEAGEIYQVAGLMTRDPAPVAYAAACFAQAGQIDRARILTEHLRATATNLEALEPWLAIAGAAAREV